MSEDERRMYALDTSVLIDDPELPLELANDGVVCLPFMTLQELNKQKDGSNRDLARSARRAIKNLNKIDDSECALEQVAADFSAISGVSGAQSLEKSEPDDRIIVSALNLALGNPNNEVIFQTQDVNQHLKIKFFAKNLKNLSSQLPKKNEHSYIHNKKTRMVNLPEDFSFGECNKGGDFSDVVSNNADFFENEGVIGCLYSRDKGKFVPSKPMAYIDGKLSFTKDVVTAFAASPMAASDKCVNFEQILAINQLLHTGIGYHALVGKAGTGKTFLACAAASQLLASRDFDYETIYLTRAPTPVGKTLGFVPGDLNKKSAEWLMGLQDNFTQLARLNGNDARIKQWLEKGGSSEVSTNFEKKIVYLSYEHIRGRSLDKSIVIIDEAQNMPIRDVITFCTRTAGNSKMIFTGDPTQIDHPYINEGNNGLTFLINLLQGDKYFAYTKFEQVIRSKFVRAFIKRLDEYKKN